MTDKESTAYLKKWFTPELAIRFSNELGLTVIADILKVTNSQVDNLDIMDGQKKAFKRVRDNLIRDQELSKKLAELQSHGF
jgi:hypothetical protein